MDYFEKNQNEVEAKLRKNLIIGLKQMGVGIWAFAVVITAVFAFNEGAPVVYIVAGIIAIIGAIVAAVLAYKVKDW